jgi:hypothetical protein
LAAFFPPKHLAPSSIANRKARESAGEDFFNNPGCMPHTC